MPVKNFYLSLWSHIIYMYIYEWNWTIKSVQNNSTAGYHKAILKIGITDFNFYILYIYFCFQHLFYYSLIVFNILRSQWNWRPKNILNDKFTETYILHSHGLLPIGLTFDLFGHGFLYILSLLLFYHYFTSKYFGGT